MVLARFSHSPAAPEATVTAADQARDFGCTSVQTSWDNVHREHVVTGDLPPETAARTIARILGR